MSKKLKKSSRNNNREDYLFYENQAVKAGYSKVAGIDEAGRGPLAGPVVASAVIIHNTDFTERIDDSKKLTERMRERAFLEVLKHCDVGIGSASVDEVDELNIFNATLLAMKRAVLDLKEEPAYLLIDGKMDVALSQPKTFLIGGESLSMSIACASIIAKVFRDRFMMELDQKYPQYGFKKHKGYGTKEHMANIKRYGLCPVHRKTFRPFGGKADYMGPVLEYIEDRPQDRLQDRPHDINEGEIYGI